MSVTREFRVNIRAHVVGDRDREGCGYSAGEELIVISIGLVVKEDIALKAPVSQAQK